MLRVDCYEFFKLGLYVHPLTNLDSTQPLSDNLVPLFQAKSAVLSFFNTFPLKTCQAPARALYDALLAVVPDQISDLRLVNEDDSPRTLTYIESGGIRTAATELEAVLKAELSNWDTFFVSQKGGYNTSDLISSAVKLLPETAQMYITAEILEDINSCGQCIAFNLGTAAAFHIIRAAEAYIVQYYEFLFGVKPPTKARNWGAYIKNMERCGNADRKVLGWMAQIKDQYRNPVLHPEERVSPDDALEFVTACISLIASISRVLAKAGAKTPFEIQKASFKPAE